MKIVTGNVFLLVGRVRGLDCNRHGHQMGLNFVAGS